MKLRMLTVAVTAIALSAQGVAQQSNDGLERALADLNSGLVADSHAGVDISGDVRIRNNWTENAGRKDIDTRFRLNFAANINESVSAFLGTVQANDWDAGATADGGIEQAYININSLFGDGGAWTIGTKHNTVASGRIRGHDDWDNTDAGDTGIWYSHDAGGSNLSLGLLEGAGGGGEDLLTVELDWGLNIPGMGDVTISPYHLADRTDGGLPSQGTEGSTTGAEFSGSFLGFGFDYEMAKRGDASASAFGLSINIDALGAIPGVSSGAVDFTSTSADGAFGATNGVSWMSTGISGSAAGGAWSTNGVDDRDSSSFGVSFSPAEGWSGRLARVESDGANEWDITMNHTFGGGVAGWFGYASNDEADNTLWMTLGVDF